jgi:hypothetical protein
MTQHTLTAIGLQSGESTEEGVEGVNICTCRYLAQGGVFTVVHSVA